MQVKEVSLHGQFFQDFFQNILGYRSVIGHWFSPIIRMKSLQDKDLTENTKLKKLFPS